MTSVTNNRSLRRPRTDIAALLLLATVALFPFNIELAAGMRPADVAASCFIAAAAVSGRLSLSSLALAVALAATAILAVSNIIGDIVTIGPPRLEGMVFLYRYWLVVLFPAAVLGVISRRSDRSDIYWTMLAATIGMIAWVFAYRVLVSSGYIVGSWRPSFPLTDDYSVSDAHLYSAFLSIAVTAIPLVLRPRLRIPRVVVAGIVIAGVIALFITGSRTGLVALFGVGIVMMTATLARVRTGIGGLLAAIVVLFVVIGFVTTVLSIDIGKSLAEISSAFERSTNFALSDDISTTNRLQKLDIAFQDADRSGWLFGLGPLFASILWYDGVIAILLAHGGIALVASVAVLVASVVASAADRSRLAPGTRIPLWSFIALLVGVIVSNGITEYILVSRYAIPVLTILALSYDQIKGVNATTAKRQTSAVRW